MKLDELENHEFLKTLLNDAIEISKDRDIDIFEVEILDANFSEYEFYIHKTGFYFFHLIQLCYQLEYGIELLSNFNYSKKSKVTRDQHLTYNVENYIIRLSSINDRLLQLVNAVFHLCIDEKNVNDRIVLTNLKVSRTNFEKLFKQFKNSNTKYIGERNTIIHKHSYLEKKLRKIHVLYESNFLDKYNNMNLELTKDLRKDVLTKYIKETKSEFSKINSNCFSNLIPIFDFLQVEYGKMKVKLKINL